MKEALNYSLPCAVTEIDDFIATPSPEVIETVRTWDSDVLVLGAGGKMGLHLCAMIQKSLELIGSGRSVIAVSRFGNLMDQDDFESRNIRTIAGDLRDEAFLSSLPDTKLVFFLAGAKFGTASNPELLNQMNVEVPEKVARRFHASRIVAFSTGCVYAYTSPESGGSTEESDLIETGDYSLSCLGREQMFTEASLEFGTPAVLIRLNYSVEFRYGVLVDICQRVMQGKTVDATMGNLNLIWQGDAVDHIIRSSALAKSPPQPINITGKEILRIGDLARKFGELLGREPVIAGEEAETAWLSNAAWSHSLFGEPRVDLETMMKWTVSWLGTGGDTHGKPTGFEKRDGKF